MKRKTKIILFLLFSMIAIIFFPNKIYATTLSDLKAKFPDGRYWNHITQSNHNSYRCEVEGCNKPDLTTDKPCVTHTGECAVGQNDCNSFDGAIQCRGFGYKIFYDYYGVHYYDCPTHTDLNSIKPGDIIIYAGKNTPSYDDGGHTAWVTGMDEDNLYVTECNVGEINCVIRWNDVLPKSDIYSIISIISAPHEINDFELTAEINPYRPSILSWTEVEGASFYRIQAVNSDGILLENPDYKPHCWGANPWCTEENFYIRTLPAGNYKLYIEAFSESEDSIKTSNEIQISTPNAEIHFVDENFKEYLEGYISLRESDLKDFDLSDGINFNDLPRTLALTYRYYSISDHLPENCDCSIYILNEDGTPNYKIEKFEMICNSIGSWR